MLQPSIRPATDCDITGDQAAYYLRLIADLNQMLIPPLYQRVMPEGTATKGMCETEMVRAGRGRRRIERGERVEGGEGGRGLVALIK